MGSHLILELWWASQPVARLKFVFSMANFNGLGGSRLYVPNRVASAGSLQVAFLGL
jgi:hypothetical protein